MKRTPSGQCSVPICTRPAQRTAGALCKAHKSRLRRTGNLRADDPIQEPGSDLDRFMRYVAVNADTGCWEWTGYREPGGGYARFGLGRPMNAHRAAWLLLRGSIPEGMQVDHLCRVRHCVNPAHLEPVTAKENTRRTMPHRGFMVDADNLPVHCRKGHPLSGSNLGRRSDGGRKCLACMRDYQRAYLARKAAS